MNEKLEMDENILNRIKSAKSAKSVSSAKSKRSPAGSKSPDKKAHSAKSHKSPPKSAKSTKSKSPKSRKSTGKSEFNSSSFNITEIVKSTPEFDDLSYQGLTILNVKLFTSKFFFINFPRNSAVFCKLEVD